MKQYLKLETDESSHGESDQDVTEIVLNMRSNTNDNLKINQEINTLDRLNGQTGAPVLTSQFGDYSYIALFMLHFLLVSFPYFLTERLDGSKGNAFLSVADLHSWVSFDILSYIFVYGYSISYSLK